MSTLATDLRLAQPHTIDEAVAARAKFPDSRYVAGGTDLIVNMRRGISRHDVLIDLAGIDELGEIKSDSGGMSIGAGVTIAALARDAAIAPNITAVTQAAEVIAGPGHRMHGDGRRQSVPRHALHLLQSKRMVAQRQRLIVSKTAATSVMSRRKASVATPPSAAIWRRRSLVYGAEVDIAGPQGRAPHCL